MQHSRYNLQRRDQCVVLESIESAVKSKLGRGACSNAATPQAPPPFHNVQLDRHPSSLEMFLLPPRRIQSLDAATKADKRKLLVRWRRNLTRFVFTCALGSGVSIRRFRSAEVKSIINVRKSCTGTSRIPLTSASPRSYQ